MLGEANISPSEDLIKKVKLVRERFINSEEFDYLLKLYPDSKPTLRELILKGYTLALLSNSSRKFVEKVVKRFELDKYFSLILTADDLENPKPHPEGLILIFNHFQQEVKAYVGDTQYDCLMAKNYSCKFFLIDRPWNKNLNCEVRIKSLKSLLEYM